MVYIFCGDSSSVIVNLDCNSVINNGNAYVYLVRYCLAFKTYILDRIGKKVDDRPYDQLRITVKQRIRSFLRQRKNDISGTRIILDIGICSRYRIPDIEDLHPACM